MKPSPEGDSHESEIAPNTRKARRGDRILLHPIRPSRERDFGAVISGRFDGMANPKKYALTG